MTTDYTQPSTGFSYTIPNGTTLALIDPTGPLALGSITLPSSPADEDILTIACSLSIALTNLYPNAGQILKNIFGALTFLPEGRSCAFYYKASNSTWYRIG